MPHNQRETPSGCSAGRLKGRKGGKARTDKLSRKKERDSPQSG